MPLHRHQHTSSQSSPLLLHSYPLHHFTVDPLAHSMTIFFNPILEHLCPLFILFAQTWSLFAQMWSCFAQNPIPNPCSLLYHHTCLSGICTYITLPSIPPHSTPFQHPSRVWQWWMRVGINSLLSSISKFSTDLKRL